MSALCGKHSFGHVVIYWNCLFHRTFLYPCPVNISVSQKNIEQALYVLQCYSEKME